MMTMKPGFARAAWLGGLACQACCRAEEEEEEFDDEQGPGLEQQQASSSSRPSSDPPYECECRPTCPCHHGTEVFYTHRLTTMMQDDGPLLPSSSSFQLCDPSGEGT